MTERRFPPPWDVETIPGGLKICDATGQSLDAVAAGLWHGLNPSLSGVPFGLGMICDKIVGVCFHFQQHNQGRLLRERSCPC